MFLYLAVIAALNLCIGYALGVYIGVLPGVASPAATPPPARPPKAKPEAPPEEATEKRSWKAPLERLFRWKFPWRRSASDLPQAAPAGSAPRSTTPPGTPPSTESILSGLASFRDRLSTVGEGIKAAEATPDAIDHCAGELKQTGTDYLGQVGETLHQFGENPATSSAAAIKDTLQAQSDHVAEVTSDIDQQVDPNDPEQSRSKLLASTEQLDASAAHTQEQVEMIAAVDQLPGATRPSTPVDTVELPAASVGDVLDGTEAGESAMAALERLMQATTDYLAESDEKKPLHMAAVAFDPKLPAGGELEVDEKLNAALLSLIEMSLDSGQQAACDDQGRVLLLLAGDDETTASRRCERIRQQVAVTTFQYQGKDLQATVSCGLSDSDRAADRGKLLDFLAESIDEARRLGANRTFHHDGKFPAPIVPHTIEVAPRTVDV